MSFTASDEELQELAAQFKEIDVDKNGTLSFDEFSAALLAQTQEDIHLSSGELRRVFNAINQDGSGEIKYSEFIAANLTQKEYTDVQLKAAFKR